MKIILCQLVEKSSGPQGSEFRNQNGRKKYEET